MISIYMIIAVQALNVLTKGTTECNFPQCNRSCLCFGEVGQPLIFRLTDKVNTYFTLMKDGKQRIFKSDKYGTVTRYDKNVRQSEGIYDGTVKLGNATKGHSGDYTMEEHRSDGVLLRKVTIQLQIKAPVTKPSMSQTCLSSEQMMVSCSYEGDGVEIILTLEGQLLIQTTDHSQSVKNWTADKSSVSNVTASLHGQTTGNLMCQVNNNVSRDETVIRLEVCKGTGTTECSFPKCNGSCLCFGEVGQPLIFRLTDKVNTYFTLMKDGKQRIFKSDKYGTVTRYDKNVRQSEGIYDGTVKLGNATKGHSGNYTLEEHGSDGVLLRKVTIQLQIKAWVTKPSVSQTCLSSEQMTVSCSYEGDGAESILTLDGQLLPQTSQSMKNWTADKASVSNVTVNLHGQTTGDLMCQVNNNVSRDETVIHLEVCKDSSVPFRVASIAVRAGLIALLNLALCFIIFHLRKKRSLCLDEGASKEDGLLKTSTSTVA